jgi:hypothetical protein
MADSTMPRYLDYRQAAILKQLIDAAVRSAFRTMTGEGADPACLNHEVGLALARAACLLHLDLLAGAGSTIERLEAVVAELGAKLELAKIATGHVEDRHGPGPNGGRMALHRAMIENGEAGHGPMCSCLTCRQ